MNKEYTSIQYSVRRNVYTIELELDAIPLDFSVSNNKVIRVKPQCTAFKKISVKNLKTQDVNS